MIASAGLQLKKTLDSAGSKLDVIISSKIVPGFYSERQSLSG